MQSNVNDSEIGFLAVFHYLMTIIAQMLYIDSLIENYAIFVVSFLSNLLANCCYFAERRDLGQRPSHTMQLYIQYLITFKQPNCILEV
jgi:hypothetical protein